MAIIGQYYREMSVTPSYLGLVVVVVVVSLSEQTVAPPCLLAQEQGEALGSSEHTRPSQTRPQHSSQTYLGTQRIQDICHLKYAVLC